MPLTRKPQLGRLQVTNIGVRHVQQTPHHHASDLDGLLAWWLGCFFTTQYGMLLGLARAIQLGRRSANLRATGSPLAAAAWIATRPSSEAV